MHRDQAPEQMCNKITEWNRQMMIKDSYAEPGHPNQNPVEAECIQILKAGLQGIMTRTSAPEASWPFILKYLCDVNNHCATPMLNWKTPISVRHGYTPDISAFLQFQFYEPIYFQVDESSPSTGEAAGYWIGVADNVGDALTYHIWSHKTRNVLQRSVIRTADPKRGGIINMKHPFDEDSDEEVDVVEPGTTLEDVAIPIKAKDPSPKLKCLTRTAKHKVRPQSKVPIDATELPQPAMSSDLAPPNELGDKVEPKRIPEVPMDPVNMDFTVEPNQAPPPEEPPPRNDFGPTIGIDDLDQTHPK